MPTRTRNGSAVGQRSAVSARWRVTAAMTAAPARSNTQKVESFLIDETRLACSSWQGSHHSAAWLTTRQVHCGCEAR